MPPSVLHTAGKHCLTVFFYLSYFQLPVSPNFQQHPAWKAFLYSSSLLFSLFSSLFLLPSNLSGLCFFLIVQGFPKNGDSDFDPVGNSVFPLKREEWGWGGTYSGCSHIYYLFLNSIFMGLFIYLNTCVTFIGVPCSLVCCTFDILFSHWLLLFIQLTRFLSFHCLYCCQLLLYHWPPGLQLPWNNLIFPDPLTAPTLANRKVFIPVMTTHSEGVPTA